MQEPVATLKHPEFRGRIGVACRDITPPVGIYARLWGSATHDVAEGVHRPLLASCLVFRDSSNSNELILITMDASRVPQDDVGKLRNLLLKRCNLQPHQLILHPSHSHSAPRLARQHADRPGGHLIIPYLESLPSLYSGLIDEARESVREATLTWAYGKCALAFNRDSIDAASDRDICGINVEQKADDTLLVGRITDRSGSIIATIVNYACHPVSMGGGNRLISPDYPGALREVVERETGGAKCLFLHGASGDLTPRRSYEAVPEAADQNGREVGYAALSVLAGMVPPGQELDYQGIEESGTPLGVWQLKPKSNVAATLSGKIVSTKLQVKDMETRDELRAKLRVATERFEIERLERSLVRREQVGDAKEGSFLFTVWRLGDAFLVSTPAEAYSRLQIALREKFPNTTVAVLNISDGAAMYLPIAQAYRRDTYQARVALYRSGSLERVIDQAAQAIHDMI